MKPKQQSCHYFVDEAGDPTLFDGKGKVLIGSNGCSRYFILGLLQVDGPDSLTSELKAIQARLLADPYFANVPSMQPNERKTALAFHAKDDLPEVRREVFSLLMNRKDLRFFAIVRDKASVLSYVKSRNSFDAGYHYKPDELYDFMIRRLFRDRLHLYEQYRIYFARRGSSNRTQSLKIALQAARERFAHRFHQEPANNTLDVIPAYSKDVPCLQAVDYYLWALQRLFERGEDRYVSLLWPTFRLIIDVDDRRFATYGTYYNKKRVLNSLAIRDRKILENFK